MLDRTDTSLSPSCASRSSWSRSFCLTCGYSHAPATRQRALLRLLPATLETIRDAWPCYWTGPSGDRQLWRDMRAVGARKEVGGDLYAVEEQLQEQLKQGRGQRQQGQEH